MQHFISPASEACAEYPPLDDDEQSQDTGTTYQMIDIYLAGFKHVSYYQQSQAQLQSDCSGISDYLGLALLQVLCSSEELVQVCCNADLWFTMHV